MNGALGLMGFTKILCGTCYPVSVCLNFARTSSPSALQAFRRFPFPSNVRNFRTFPSISFPVHEPLVTRDAEVTTSRHSKRIAA